MVFIKYKSKKLVIQSSNKDIYNWKHQLFFVTLSDFKFDENKQYYVFSDNTQITKILNEVIQYFNEEKIKYQCDEKIENIISDFEKENKEYKYLLKKGIQVKKDKCSKLNIIKLIRELKSYQKVGVNHLLEIKNGANFSVPGSGKTSVIYAVYVILRSKNIIDKIFVIGPRSCF